MQKHEVLRTSDHTFENLPGYPFAPHYLSDLPGYKGLRLHYLDEGTAQAADTYLCLHGQPTWSYLYRKMIPIFQQSGARVIAPDLYGFGKSDKPTDERIYTFDFHRSALLAFIEYLDLQNITLVVQDWGGLLGLTLPMVQPDRYSRLLVMNTTLATGDMPLPKAFLQWREYSASNPDLNIEQVMQLASPNLPAHVAHAYAAPFPDARYKAAVRRFPALVPDNPNAPGAAISRQARDWWQREWDGATYMVIGMNDPMLGSPAMHTLRAVIRNCPPALELPKAGHFVQEDAGPVVARAALEAFQNLEADPR